MAQGRASTNSGQSALGVLEVVWDSSSRLLGVIVDVNFFTACTQRCVFLPPYCGTCQSVCPPHGFADAPWASAL